MVASRTVGVLALLGVLALSGCIAAPETVNEDVREVQVQNGSLPVDANAVYGRVVGLVGSDPSPPRSVRVRDPESITLQGNTSAGYPGLPPFWVAMNVTPKPGSGIDFGSFENGVTSGTGAITIYTGDGEADVIHYVLAHEFVHYIQFERGRANQVGRAVDTLSTDGQFVLRSVLEGVAVYTTDEYIRRYVDTDETNSGLYRRIGERLAVGGVRQYGNSQYVFGARYVESRIDAPAEADRIYRNPPRSSEQVIHGYAPGEEPVKNLSVSVEANGWQEVGTDRMGEGFLRVALRNGLDGPTADRVAAGWGSDSLRIYGRTNDTDDESFVWALRWDDAENATEFVEGFRTYLDARGNRSGAVWYLDDDTAAVRRVGSDTVVVLIGDERFVRETTASADGGQVDVSLPPASEAPLVPEVN